jgi:hypothetical protein
MEKQSEMCFADILMGFICAGLIAQAYLLLTNSIAYVIIRFQLEKNAHAEFVKAKYIKRKMLTEEQTNQNVPYICKNCTAKDCEYLNSKKDFLRCPYKIIHDEREKLKLNSGGIND